MTLQDLITAVIGILIVFCLLLILSSTQDDSDSAVEAKFDGGLTNLVTQINTISNAIEKIKPDLVFGESTLFHELLVINACKSRGILYLHPSSCRYPTNRFSFYK